MEKVLFTQLKTIAECAKNYYKKHDNCLDFHVLVKYLYRQNMLTDAPIIFRRSSRTLSDSEFCEHALEQVISASKIISNSHQHDVYESFGLFYEKDIYTMVTLPFIRSEHHVHDYYEMLYVYRGSCSYFFQDTSFL